MEHNLHYRFHMDRALVRILSQIIAAHAPHPFSWRSILILSSHLSIGFRSDPLFFRVYHQSLVCIYRLPQTCQILRPAQSSPQKIIIISPFWPEFFLQVKSFFLSNYFFFRCKETRVSNIFLKNTFQGRNSEMIPIGIIGTL